jgi:NADH dehydrogenase, FAD-containing subunit
MGMKTMTLSVTTKSILQQHSSSARRGRTMRTRTRLPPGGTSSLFAFCSPPPGDGFCPKRKRPISFSAKVTTRQPQRRQLQQQSRSTSLYAVPTAPNDDTTITPPTPTTSRNICILGGGFGGLNAALTLSSLPYPPEEKPTITLIDCKDRFVFLPLLYELCVGDADLNEVAPIYRSLLQNTNIEFRQGTVQGIDVEKNVVHLLRSNDQDDSSCVASSASVGVVSYDSLVVATGSHVNLDFIPGATNRAIPFYTIQDCYELRKILTLLDSIPAKEFQRQLNVVIVGGGYSGVELALNLMERLKPIGKGVKVTMVHRGNDVLENASEYNQKTAKERLQNMGVNIMTGTSVMEVIDPDDGSNCDDVPNNRLLLQQQDGDTMWKEDWKSRSRVVVLEKDSKQQEILDADILLWTAGAMSSNVQKGILNSKLPRDSSGRIVVTKYMNAKGCDNVFALGDCSRVMNELHPYPATAAVAMQQAPFVAWNVYSHIMTARMKNGTASSVMDSNVQENIKPMPFSLVNLGEMMTLGGQDATISSMGVVQLRGVAASVMRRLIYALRMPTPQQGLLAAMLSSAKRLETTLKQVKSVK